MKTLLGRINQVINTAAFALRLAQAQVDLIEFQLGCPESCGDFTGLPSTFQEAILAGEQEMESTGLVDITC
jgi:hypothetical protein